MDRKNIEESKNKIQHSFKDKNEKEKISKLNLLQKSKKDREVKKI